VADVVAITTRVAVERAANRAGDAGRKLEPTQTLIATAKNEIREVGAAADVDGGAVELHAVACVADHEPAEAVVRDEQVAAAAEQEHRHPRLAPGAQRGHQLVRRLRGDEPVRRAADAERRVVAQRLAREQSRAERFSKSVFDRHGGSGHGRMLTRDAHGVNTPSLSAAMRGDTVRVVHVACDVSRIGDAMKIEITYCGQ